MVFFFILFSWFRSSDTSGWWLQISQFWRHSLTSRIFFPKITLKTQLDFVIFFSRFSLLFHSKRFLDFYSGSLGSFGQRPPEAQNFSQSWADGLVSAPSLSAVVGVFTSCKDWWDSNQMVFEVTTVWKHQSWMVTIEINFLQVEMRILWCLKHVLERERPI